MGLRRTLMHITPQDESGEGRPETYGFGPGHLAWIGGAKRDSIRRIMKVRGVPLHLPVVAVAWGLARRGKPKLAQDVLDAFGLAYDFRVRYRTVQPITVGRFVPIRGAITPHRPSEG